MLLFCMKKMLFFMFFGALVAEYENFPSAVEDADDFRPPFLAIEFHCPGTPLEFFFLEYVPLQVEQDDFLGRFCCRQDVKRASGKGYGDATAECACDACG